MTETKERFKTWELWRLLADSADENPNNRLKKQIAKELDVSDGTITKYCSEFDNSGYGIDLERTLKTLAKWQRFTGDKRIKEWIDNYFEVYGK